jgi:sigma-E factor negative regulatory protein RseB
LLAYRRFVSNTAAGINPVGRAVLGLRRGSLALCLALATAPVGAAVCGGTDPEALEWLRKMSGSMLEVSYHGVVTLERGGDMQVAQVSHAVADGTSTERMTQLNGQGAQVVRAAHPLHCVHPGHRILQLGEELEAGRCGIADHYRFGVAEGDRVAGRQAVRISIEPRDMYRFGYVMELDRETGLLLTTETLGRGGKRLEKFQFANLYIGDPMPAGAEVNLVHEAQHPHPAEAATGPAVSRGWAPGWLPRGFTLTDAAAAKTSRKTYTDGLAVFSVFVEELTREIRPGEGVVRDGGTTSYTRGLRLAEQPILVTVIGEVPVNTARMVADSVGWVRSP